MRDYFPTKLLGQGWYVKDEEITEENWQQRVILDIEHKGTAYICNRCRGVFKEAYHWRQQEVRLCYCRSILQGCSSCRSI